jgi:hypothetical protein
VANLLLLWVQKRILPSICPPDRQEQKGNMSKPKRQHNGVGQFQTEDKTIKPPQIIINPVQISTY